MKKTVVNRIDLGNTRIAGYTLYDEISKEFQETTPKQIKILIKNDVLNGLKLVNDEIKLDTEGFNMCNLMIKSGIGNYRKLYEDNKIINCMYSVVRVLKTDTNIFYEIVSNKCSRTKVTTERLKMLIEMGYVAGVRLIKDKIEVCNGVTIELFKKGKKENNSGVTKNDDISLIEKINGLEDIVSNINSMNVENDIAETEVANSSKESNKMVNSTKKTKKVKTEE
ncbi:hypothetical protein FDB52_12095 [Clostridium botulinum]|nr:hypothetical protein [Clostridium botulinum]